VISKSDGSKCAKNLAERAAEARAF
jgi:hypothetical protein